MATLIGQVASLLKLRIGVAIAASAVAGVAAAKGPALPLWQTTAFAVAVLGGAGAAGAFNHYYERDLDAHMARTGSVRSRAGSSTPIAGGCVLSACCWLLRSCWRPRAAA